MARPSPPPANLAGRSGPVEITLRVRRNTECTGDYFDHYALSITAAFDEKNCESIEARNGIVASAGSKKQVSFTVVPGSEADLTITMDAVQFAMDPISINGVPMSMDVGSIDTTELKADMEVSSRVRSSSGASVRSAPWRWPGA